jgi:hypothetical protein
MFKRSRVWAAQLPSHELADAVRPRTRALSMKKTITFVTGNIKKREEVRNTWFKETKAMSV